MGRKIFLASFCRIFWDCQAVIFVKVKRLSTDVKAHILVVNQEMAALSQQIRMVFLRVEPDATRNFVQKIKF